MVDTGWGNAGGDATWTVVKPGRTTPLIERPQNIPMGGEALMRFKMLTTDPTESVSAVIRWGDRDIYQIVVQGGLLTINHSWDDAHQEQVAQATRKLRKNARYWLKFCLEPDWLMPAHANAYAYLWPDSGAQPKTPTVGYKQEWAADDTEEEEAL